MNDEELLKALAYDREQYSKGYKEGYKEGAKAFAEKLTGWTFTQEKINNILAEMVGGMNEKSN